jgi:hypothetical protein
MNNGLGVVRGFPLIVHFGVAGLALFHAVGFRKVVDGLVLGLDRERQRDD